MKVGYVDSSMILGLIFEEPGYQRERDRIESFARVFSSNLLEAELRSAVRREGVSDQQLVGILARFDWVHPDRPLTHEFLEVLAAGLLRGADLWHLACALYLRGAYDQVELLSLDRRQIDVADRLGLISG